MLGGVALKPQKFLTDPEAVHKNNSVSGRPAGWLKKRCDWRLFFSFLQKKKIFFKKMDNIFLSKKNKCEKKKKMRPPDWP